MIRVIIIDEQPLFRKGLHAILEGMEDCKIVGDSTDTTDVLGIVRAYNPNIALIDTGLTSSNPLELARQIHHIVPQLALILLTPSENKEDLFQAVSVGAAAYCSRYITTEELTEIVRRVSRGERLIGGGVLSKPQLASHVLKSFREVTVKEEEVIHTKDTYSPLSNREAEILDYIAYGNGNKEIAASLRISNQTVKNHITSILRKLSVNDRTAAVVYALRHGWIKLHDE
jgi:DNA-binding NarL/FixJ family response regulator